VTHLAEEETSVTSVAGAVSQPSKLFPSLIVPQDDQRRLTILEVGSALPETVEFFSSYKCRIHFLDLYSEPLIRDYQSGQSAKELQPKFEALLNFPDGTLLDICLFWDFLCYLDDQALRAFNAALSPYVHPGTRAHGFGVHHLAIKLGNRRYGVAGHDRLSVRPCQAKKPETRPHSQVEMHEMLSCFDFERGLLLPDGKLELLLKARVAAQ
jgi:hypothetical protein